MISTISSYPARQQQVVERPANVQAQALTGRPYLSFSQISLMRSCPKKFQLHYIQHAPADFLPASLVFGSAIHAAVETHFRGLLAGVSTGVGDLVQAFHLSWEEQLHDAGGLQVRYPKDQDAPKLQKLAETMLGVLLVDPASQPRGTLLGVEEEFTVTLVKDMPDVLARVDLVYQTAGSVVVRDFKTARAKWNAEKAEQSADQLYLYARILRDISCDVNRPVAGEYVVLTKQKTPQVQLLPVPITPEGIRRTQDAIATTWQAILAGNYYPSPSPMNCSTCQYRSRCPVFAK